MTFTVDAVMALAPVIPVLVIEDVADAAPIAEALVKGGLPALEVTLRTPAALDVIREMAKVPGAVVGAGTVIQFTVITFIAHWPHGFWWNRPGGGWEYPLLWGLMFAAIALRGGGPYSLDRRIGWEL